MALQAPSILYVGGEHVYMYSKYGKTARSARKDTRIALELRMEVPVLTKMTRTGLGFDRLCDRRES